jgi:hypothetical protein
MTAALPRRAVLVLALLTAVVLGLALPARADFTDQAASPAMSVTTVTVQPPTGLSTAGSSCDTDGTLHLRLSWTKSATARVSSYRIRTYTFFGLVNVPLGTVSATTTSVSADLPQNSLGYAFTATTVTDYGWTAESDKTGTIRC